MFFLIIDFPFTLFYTIVLHLIANQIYRFFSLLYAVKYFATQKYTSIIKNLNQSSVSSLIFFFSRNFAHICCPYFERVFCESFLSDFA